jgi:hypothetical protein
MKPLGDLGFELATLIGAKFEYCKIISDKNTSIQVTISDVDIKEMTAAAMILEIEPPYTTPDKTSTWIEMESDNVEITVYAKK